MRHIGLWYVCVWCADCVKLYRLLCFHVIVIVMSVLLPSSLVRLSMRCPLLLYGKNCCWLSVMTVSCANLVSFPFMAICWFDAVSYFAIRFACVIIFTLVTICWALVSCTVVGKCFCNQILWLKMLLALNRHTYLAVLSYLFLKGAIINMHDMRKSKVMLFVHKKPLRFGTFYSSIIWQFPWLLSRRPYLVSACHKHSLR